MLREILIRGCRDSKGRGGGHRGILTRSSSLAVVPLAEQVVEKLPQTPLISSAKFKFLSISTNVLYKYYVQSRMVVLLLSMYLHKKHETVGH